MFTYTQMLEKSSRYVGFPIATLHCLVEMIENSRLVDNLRYWREQLEKDGLIKKIRKTRDHRDNIRRSIQVESERLSELQRAVADLLA